MSEAQVLLFVAVAWVTAAVTATFGVGGGTVLLVVMLTQLEPRVAIPLHGVVQLVSNVSRAGLLRRHLRPSVLGWFALPLLPAGAAGLWVLHRVSPQAARGVIGAFVLVSTWAPRSGRIGGWIARRHPTRRFFWAGAGAGFLNVAVGASGPLLGAFFLDAGLARQAVVGTFAACQTLNHLVRTGLFLGAGFAFTSYTPLLLAMGAAVVLGSWTGTRLLERLPERGFRLAYRVVLSLIALRLVADVAVAHASGG